MHNPIEQAQLQMQQKLGRCMLRLQQYERLLKSIISSMAVEGPVGDLNSKRARQIAKASGKSLGTLVHMFTGSHLISTPVVGENVEADLNSGDLCPDVAWLSTRFTISMPPELYAQTTEGLSELVAMRNDMVHHLIERFDISDEDGCRAAAMHLDTCYHKINGHLERLNAWADGLAHSQAAVLSFLESKAFEDAFLHGINPDGTVC